MAEQPKMRVAFREEGKWWVAYMAKIDTMAGSVPMGRIRMSLAQANESVKQAFMDAMKVAFAALVKDALGMSPTEWETRSAPEHEKAGHA